MSFDPDMMIDRRKMRRKLSLWRMLAFGGALVAVLAIGFLFGGRSLVEGQQQHLARLAIDGIITGDKATLDTIRRAKDSKASAVIVSIDSPGGTTTGSEAVFRELRELSAAKPTVAVVRGTAASGAYIAAMGTEHIVAPQTAIVGSIGVIMQYPNVTKLLDTVGVKMEAVRSAPLKAMPSGMEPTTPEARAALEETIQDSFAWFKDMVKDRRRLTPEQLAKVSDGRVFTGRQSLPLKLIDEIGSEKEALAWLDKEKNISKNLKILDYRRKPSRQGLDFLSLAEDTADTLGFDRVATALRQNRRALEVQSLDGLLVVWQPSSQN